MALIDLNLSRGRPRLSCYLENRTKRTMLAQALFFSPIIPCKTHQAVRGSSVLSDSPIDAQRQAPSRVPRREPVGQRMANPRTARIKLLQRELRVGCLAGSAHSQIGSDRCTRENRESRLLCGASNAREDCRELRSVAVGNRRL